MTISLPWCRPADTLSDAEAIALVRVLGTALAAGATPAATLRALSQVRPTPPAATPRWGAAAPASPTVQQRLLHQLVEAAEHGVPLGPVWDAAATELGSDTLRLIAQVWTLSDRTGAPPAAALRACAAMLEAHVAQQRAVEAAAAGALATRTLLTLLPLGGPLFALALGLDVREVYANPLAVVAVLLGIALLLAGRRWVSHLIAVALSPGPGGRRQARAHRRPAVGTT